MKPEEINILVGCEESQEVCKAFRALGFNAFSCDIQPSSGGEPQWHIEGDVLQALKSREWHCGIFFPPCDHLSKAGGAHWKKPEKQKLQSESLHFVKTLMESCQFTAIENPVGKISTAIRKPDQKIQPFHFGHPWLKETCLWLKGLPILSHTNTVEPQGNWVKPGNSRPHRRFYSVPEGGNRDKKQRSKTFPGVAQAMADQWGKFLIENL